MQIEGALITEQRVTFAIIIVKSHVLSSPSEREEMQRAGASLFRGVPIILMAQDSRGTPTYYGRKDIVNFLSKINPARIPWKRFTIS